MLGFGAVLVLSGSATVVTISGVARIQAQQAYTTGRLRPTLAAGNEALLVQRDFDSDNSQAVMDPTADAIDDEKNVGIDLQRLTTILKRARTLTLDKRMTRALDKFEVATYGPHGFVSVEGRALRARKAGNFKVANAAMVDADLKPAHDAIIDYPADVQTRIDAGDRESARTGHLVMTIGIGLGLAVVLGFLIALTLSRSISRSVSRLTSAARKIAAGGVDVEADLPASGRDELGVLSATFREMALNLSRVALAAEAVAEPIFGAPNSHAERRTVWVVRSSSWSMI